MIRHASVIGAAEETLSYDSDLAARHYRRAAGAFAGRLHAWRAVWRRLMHRDLWHIGIVEHIDPHVVVAGRFAPATVTWLPRIAGGHRSAPSLGTYAAMTALFYEQYDFLADRSHIVCSVLSTDAYDRLRCGAPQALLDASQAYRTPSVFHDTESGEMAMVVARDARNADNDEDGVRFFRCRTWPTVWEAIEQCAATPALTCPTVMRHDGQWLLMGGDPAHSDALLFYTAYDLRGPWRAHAANPVRTGRNGSIPAGGVIAAADAVLYRPGRDNTRGDGAAVVMHRIDTLTADGYAEQPVAALTPWRPQWRGLGTVTYDADSGLVAFDIKTRACLNDVLRRIGGRILATIRRTCVPLFFA